jgi:hypothetical protein
MNDPKNNLERIVEDVTNRTLAGSFGIAIEKIAKEIEPRGTGKPIYENICEAKERTHFRQRTVRVWFRRTLEGPDPIDDLVMLNTYVYEHRKDELRSLDYAILLSKELPRVNAVEVRIGCEGSLYYPDWP